MSNNIGVYGLAVMGTSLARNLAHKGNNVVLFNRTTSKTENFMEKYSSEGSFIPTTTIEQFVSSLSTPRKMIIMVGSAGVDSVLDLLKPHLDHDDIVVDGGNSFYKDTDRRTALPFHFVGLGISGGELGALHGPSMMFGGSDHAWTQLAPVLTPISAEGRCIAKFGEGGAGHFVKMVHNGIEYAIMAQIAEAVGISKNWKGEMDSYLLDITERIVQNPEVENVLDEAGMKGTGLWTVQTSLEMGIPVPSISSAVLERMISTAARRRYPEASSTKPDIADAPTALNIAMRSAFIQGIELITAHLPNVSVRDLFNVWSAGCIIQAKMLHEEYEEFKNAVTVEGIKAYRSVISQAVQQGASVPVLSATLQYIESSSKNRLDSISLIQAMRDCFGAHGYKDKKTGENKHIEWF